MKLLPKQLIASHLAIWSVVTAVSSLTLISCDRLSGLKDDISGLMTDEESAESFASIVSEKEGRAVIEEESRMILLEFYSNT